MLIRNPNPSKDFTMLTLATMILHDECPPDRRAYLCNHGEEDNDDTNCTRCWQNYLLYAINGETGHPYQIDLNRARKEGWQ